MVMAMAICLYTTRRRVFTSPFFAWAGVEVKTIAMRDPHVGV